jgi:hypothetical protein
LYLTLLNFVGVNLNPVDKHTVSIISPIEADDDGAAEDAFSKDFMYSRDFLLSCFKALSIDKSLMLEDLYQEESLKPVSLEPLSQQEQEIYDSGAFNSEITRKYGNKGGRRGGGAAGGGGRGGGGQRRNNNRNHHHGHGGNHHGNFRSPTSPNEDSLREDIWDLPTNVQGSFSNGAFMVGSSSAGSGGHQEHSWKRVSQQQQQQQQHQVSPLWDAPQQHQQQQEPVWFYKDPQQNVQGPFLGREMQQWFEAGYFPANLLVRQQTDLHFEPLEVYMKQRFNGLVTFLRTVPDVSVSVAAPIAVSPQAQPQQQAWTSKYQWNTQEITWIQQQMAQNPHMKQIEVEEYLMMEKERAMQLQQQQQQQQQQQNFKPAPAPKTNAWGASKQSPISPVIDSFVTEKMEKLAVKESVPATAAAAAAVVSPKESKPAPWVGSSPAARKLSLAEIQKQEAEEAKKNVSTGSPKQVGGNPWNNKSATVNPAEKASASAVASSVEADKENLAAWIKTKLRPLDGKMDLVSFVEVLLPLNDPYTINEIVHDGIGQNFTLVNPHKLVTEFLEKKHTAGLIKGPLSVPPPPTHSAYALHLRKSSTGDDYAASSSQGSQGGFVPVQSKKTKKAASAKAKENKAAPVVGAHGKVVPGAVKKA